MTVPDVGVDPDATPPSGVRADPDPTPTASPWQEYLAAAQSLDAVLREANAEVAAAGAASQAIMELNRVRARLETQRARLVGEAVLAGVPAPQLVPTPAEQAAADAQVAGRPAAATEAVRQCHHLLDAADAQLAPAPRRPPPPLPALGPPAPGPPAPGPPAAAPGPVVPGPVVPGPVAPASPAPVPPGRRWRPGHLWLMLGIPLGVATLLLCILGLLLFITR